MTCDTDGCNGAIAENITLASVTNEPAQETEFSYASTTQETIENETEYLVDLLVSTQDDDLVVVDERIIVPDISSINDILAIPPKSSCSKHLVRNICHGIDDVKLELKTLTQLLQSIDSNLKVLKDNKVKL